MRLCFGCEMSMVLLGFGVAVPLGLAAETGSQVTSTCASIVL